MIKEEENVAGEGGEDHGLPSVVTTGLLPFLTVKDFSFYHGELLT